jgi:hypothetical protein
MQGKPGTGTAAAWIFTVTERRVLGGGASPRFAVALPKHVPAEDGAFASLRNMAPRLWQERQSGDWRSCA